MAAIRTCRFTFHQGCASDSGVDNPHGRRLFGFVTGSAVASRRMPHGHAAHRGAARRRGLRSHGLGAQRTGRAQPHRPATGGGLECADRTGESARGDARTAQGRAPPASAAESPVAETAETAGVAPPMPMAPGLANMPISGCIICIGACIACMGACIICGAAPIICCTGCMNVPA